MKLNQHVVPYGGQWAVRINDSEKVSVVVDTQELAIRIAKERAMREKSEIVIHGQNGRERERRPYNY